MVENNSVVEQVRNADVEESVGDISEDQNVFWMDVAEIVGKTVGAIVKM